MFFRKYKLIEDGLLHPPIGSAAFFANRMPLVKVYRIQALRDIPQWQVRKGDLGGRVTGKDNLSHQGQSWIKFDAQVLGNVTVQDDALIEGKAILSAYGNGRTILVKDTAYIGGRAIVMNHPSADKTHALVHTVIEGNSTIYEKAQVYNVEYIAKYARICGEARLLGASTVEGESQITGRSKLRYNVKVTGKSEITEEAIVDSNSRIYDSTIAGNAYINKNSIINNKQDFGYGHKALPSSSPKVDKIPLKLTDDAKAELMKASLKPSKKPEASVESTHAVKLFEEVLADIALYETDIVNIIKYPSMTDRSVPETREMIISLKRAKRFSDTPESKEFIEAVNDLEAKFLTAESVALKLSSSSLSIEEKKKTQKASDLLALASNEAASDNERAQAFKQAFKQLEGVIAVPEIAVETFKVKIGLKELEG